MSEISSSSILRISDEKTMELIHLYHKEECLWNTQSKNYRNKAKRSESVHRIARTLAIPNFGPRHVLMKFKNLRNSFSQELKKIAHSKMGGGEGSERSAPKYKPSVFWFDKMNSFIRPHLQKARGLHAGLVYLVDGSEEWVQVTNSEQASAPEVEPSGSENESCDSSRKRKTPIGINTKFSWKKFKMDSDSDDLTTTSTPKTAKKNPNHPANQITLENSLKDISANLNLLISRDEDYFESFGKYIAGLLRSLPHRKALEVQPQIISVITAAGLECQDSVGGGSQESLAVTLDPAVIVKLEK